jgi:hypothetical protein
LLGVMGRERASYCKEKGALIIFLACIPLLPESGFAAPLQNGLAPPGHTRVLTSSHSLKMLSPNPSLNRNENHFNFLRPTKTLSLRGGMDSKSELQDDQDVHDDILGDGTLMVDISGDGGVVKRIIRKVHLFLLLSCPWQIALAVFGAYVSKSSICLCEIMTSMVSRAFLEPCRRVETRSFSTSMVRLTI